MLFVVQFWPFHSSSIALWNRKMRNEKRMHTYDTHRNVYIGSRIRSRSNAPAIF